MLLNRLLVTAALMAAHAVNSTALAEEKLPAILLETVHDVSILNGSTAHERDWITKKNRGGFIVAGSQFINVGKLLIKGPGERTEACSGALLGSDKFITAAHCVCPVELFTSKPEEETYAQACRRRMTELQFKIVFPGIGIFDAYSNAEIMDDYRPRTAASKPLMIGAGSSRDSLRDTRSTCWEPTARRPRLTRFSPAPRSACLTRTSSRVLTLANKCSRP